LVVEQAPHGRAGDADVQPTDVAGERGAVVGHRGGDAREIGGVVAGDGLEHERGVLHGAGERAHVVADL
jgi:hypothetical protein